MKTAIYGTFAVVVWLSGYVIGIRTEASTHALQVSRITGTPYTRVLDAWQRLQASGMTDTEYEAYDEEVGLDPEYQRGFRAALNQF